MYDSCMCVKSIFENTKSNCTHTNAYYDQNHTDDKGG